MLNSIARCKRRCLTTCCWVILFAAVVSTKTCMGWALVAKGGGRGVGVSGGRVPVSVSSWTLPLSRRSRQQQYQQLQVQSTTTDDESLVSASPSSSSSSSTKALLAGAEIVELSILPHTPLGCTVEECLANSEGLVFVASVKPGSFAEQAGLREGDVIVGLSNLFGEVVDVTNEGVERVKGFVLSCSDYEPLELRVARGTRVQEEHERVLVDLCSNPGASDEEMEQCVNAFIQSTYDEDDAVYSVDIVECSVDGDADDEAGCLLDNMYNMWAEDMQFPNANGFSKPETPNDAKSSKPKVKPWSSRSSPSGTYVRDPVTGKLKNLDA